MIKKIIKDIKCDFKEELKSIFDKKNPFGTNNQIDLDT